MEIPVCRGDDKSEHITYDLLFLRTGLPLSIALLLHTPVSERVFMATRLLKVELQFQNVEVGAYAVVDHGQNRIAKQFLSDGFETLRDLLRSGQRRKVEQRSETKARFWALTLGIVAEIIIILGVECVAIPRFARNRLCESRSFPSVTL